MSMHSMIIARVTVALGLCSVYLQIGKKNEYGKMLQLVAIERTL